MARGWTYVTPDYRLCPEAAGSDVVEDVIDAFQWVQKNLGQTIILGGSSAGAFLAMTVSSLAQKPPVATLLIYGFFDLTDSRYLEPGTTVFGGPPIDTTPVIAQLDIASKNGTVLSGYPFPEDRSTDARLAFVAAMHQDAIFPDYVAGIPGLSKMISKSGPSAIPANARKLFAFTFSLTQKFPPTILIHGADDIAVFPNQSTKLEQKLKSLRVKTHLEVISGAGHGFDIGGDIDVENSSEDKYFFGPLRKALSSLDTLIL